jgi:glycosyltransferase involved in cell wall biosynthesis
MPNSITLLISTYNWETALELCLLSVCNQTKLPNEVVIADDGSSIETKKIIDLFRDRLNIIHIWHEDKGFRLAEIRNKAIVASSSEYIIQIDGDIILNKNFIADHNDFAKIGTYVRGTRTILNEDFSKELLLKKRISFSILSKGITLRENAIRIKLLSNLFDKKKLDYRNALGCNMAFWRKDLIDVNGYSNNLCGWGHEDEELCSRLINSNIYRRKLKYSAITYHIYHPERKKDKENLHLKEITKAIDLKITWAENGIKEL